MNPNIPNKQRLSEENMLHKMDILFYNAYLKAKSFYKKKAIYHFLKALILIIFLPIDITVLDSKNNLVIIFMGVAIGLSIINMLFNIGILVAAYSETKQNNIFILNVASVNQHGIPESNVQTSDIYNLQKCISTTMYNQVNMTQMDSEGLTQQLKQRYEKIVMGIIQDTVMQYSPCLSFMDSIGKLMGLGTVVFGIVSLALSRPNAAQIAVIVVFLVLEAVHIIVILLVLILIALSPVLCFLFCFYCCCCYKPTGERSELNLEAVQATQKIIMEGDGSCSICIQNFKAGQRVYVLPCSKKHMFHQGCLNGWLRASPTCPICRHNLIQG